MDKRLFNLYLDDETKNACTDKLKRLVPDQQKGLLASLVRVLLKDFLNTPDDEVPSYILEMIYDEFIYNNKGGQSRL